MNPQSGSATLYSLIALSFSSLLFSALLGPQIVMARRIAAYEADVRRKEQLEEAVMSVLSILPTDPTPRADAPTDPLWVTISQSHNQTVLLSIKDASSFLNLNTIGVDWLSQDPIAIELASVGAVREIQNLRLSGGISPRTNLEGIVPRDAMGSIFGFYGYAHPRLIDKEGLEVLLRPRLGDLSSVLAARIVSYRDAAKQDYEHFYSMFGRDLKEAVPIVSPMSLINIHFIDERLLRIVLSLQFNGKPLPNPNVALAAIISARGFREITPDALHSMIDIEEGQEDIFAFLGVQTWFWQISAEDSERRLIVIAARIPGVGRDSFRIVLKQWAKIGEST